MADESSSTAVAEKPIEAIKETTNGTISVDTDKIRSEQQETGSVDQEKGFVQAQTPKHANKKEEVKGSDQQKITPDRGEPKADDSRPPAYAGQQRAGYNGNFPPPRPHEGRPLGGSGAFQPHERRQLPQQPGHEQRYYNRGPPMQVSPGGNGANGDYQRRHYHNYPPNRGSSSRMEGGYPPHPSHAPPHHHQNGGFYDQRGYNDYGGRPPPPPSYDGPRGQYSHHSGHPPNYPQSYNRYPEGRGNAQNWGSHPPNYPSQSGGAYPRDRPPAYYHTEHHSSNGAFSRSVSTSFDRSVKSREPHHDPKMKTPTLAQGDIKSMASDDMSWKQLKQVHSVDDIGSKPPEAERPNSTSSSLTNSPTEGAEKHRSEKHAQAMVEAVEKAVTQPSSLDSLASVSSAQRPIETARTEAPPSPGSIGGSLDLMKCSSGSSGLLHLPPQQRAMEGSMLMDAKRTRDEERGDMNAATRAEGAEIRRAPSGEPPAPKRAKLDESSKDEPSAETKKKSSPLSITCSPSAPKQSRPDPKMRPKMDYHASPHTMDGYYDKPPHFSYSMDSAPSIPRDAPHNRKPGAYSSIPPRPGSAASGSTISGGPIHLDGRDPANAMVPSISSWEIHAQDSFGNGSVGGGQGLASSFSFQEFPALSASESNLGGIGEHGPPGPHGPPGSMHAAMESRNQSFEGGHYHGGGSFDHYNGGRHGPYQEGYKHGHTGSFPPHAPSWGTAASGGSYYQQGGPQNHYGPYGGRNYPPHGGMMRNYSQDGGHRASPPPGLPHPGSMSRPQGPPSGFQPPPEFAAPHNPHLARRPPPSVYIMTSSQNGGANPGVKRGTGVFSWSKEDDARLTDIMKKYKNPRDWEPIAKEHGAGKTSKECHERWIRYLKPGVRKGQWTDHEDAIVIEAVTTSSEQPFTRWSDLAQRLPGRVGKQIRDRWVNHLNPNINHLPFSKEDDLLLWEGHKKLGKRWVEISTKYFHSSRSENHIKNRWYSASFKKFISNEFGPEAYASAKGAGKNKDKKSKKLGADEATIKAR